MSDGSVLIRASDDGVVLRLRVKPRSRRDRLIGAYGGALKIEVSAAPERGKANVAVKKLLAKTIRGMEYQGILGLTKFDEYGQTLTGGLTMKVSQDGKWVAWDVSEYASGK